MWRALRTAPKTPQGEGATKGIAGVAPVWQVASSSPNVVAFGKSFWRTTRARGDMATCLEPRQNAAQGARGCWQRRIAIAARLKAVGAHARDRRAMAWAGAEVACLGKIGRQESKAAGVGGAVMAWGGA